MTPRVPQPLLEPAPRPFQGALADAAHGPLAPVARAVNVALFPIAFDRGVDKAQVGGRDGEPNLPHIPHRQARVRCSC